MSSSRNYSALFYSIISVISDPKFTCTKITRGLFKKGEVFKSIWCSASFCLYNCVQEVLVPRKGLQTEKEESSICTMRSSLLPGDTFVHAPRASHYWKWKRFPYGNHTVSLSCSNQTDSPELPLKNVTLQLLFFLQSFLSKHQEVFHFVCQKKCWEIGILFNEISRY